MCGIAGLVCFKEGCREEDHLALVERMLDLEAHRGPDDRSSVSLGKIALGAVRLSILDLSPAGRMPMSDDDGRWWIVYNGEVYNFKEIREELKRAGHRFRSRTDTEVVLHAFMEWGEACVERFVGMFAFAIHDRRTGTVTLVRDRFGIKPLYYSARGGHFLFCSEMRPLLRVQEGLRLNRRSLLEWLLYHNADVLTPDTPIEEIEAVLPGRMVTIRDGNVASRVYYDPAERIDERDYARIAAMKTEEVAGVLERILAASTEARLVSDVPVGTLCSGGLDSSLITALASRGSKKLTAFHVSVADHPDLDEKPHAQAVAKSLGIPLISFALDGAEYRRALPRTVFASDLPLAHPNSVAFALICRVARAEGVLVLLSGEGADELFGGYGWRYARYRRLLRVRRALGILPRPMREWIRRVGYAAAGLPVTTLRFDELIPLALSLVDRDARRAWRATCENAYSFVPSADDRAVLGAMLSDLDDFLVPLLRRLDRMSMSASIECRVPYLDHRVVETAVHMPLAHRGGGKGDKKILRRIAARHLPPSIVSRKKVGFPLPLGEYLAPLARPEFFLGGFCEEGIGISRRSLDEIALRAPENPFAFSCLVDLELWGRLVYRNEPLEEVEESLRRLEPNSP
ncbi:MAG: asparagine synthase (glutamine-hydrolyzing) [Candidatus Eisenbacteria bacterium]|nr:asparagine synthase (glutamine-hydrolyzing) [Candidatus Eisenbacteria bacterium]